PSHLGSKIHPSPAGNSPTRLASIGKIGGLTGRCTTSCYLAFIGSSSRPIKLAVVSSGRVFLLSPARAGGKRYSMLVREAANFDLAVKLRQGQATIGEVYTFISGLYFRGKMAYVEAFR